MLKIFNQSHEAVGYIKNTGIAKLRAFFPQRKRRSLYISGKISKD